MNSLDLLVLIGVIIGIAVFGIWRTRGRRDLSQYLKGNQTTGWILVGVSVMATQASAITFISATGQGYQDGLGFVQNYFGLPLAMIVIAAVFLPIYRKLNVFTAYEYLGQRFDAKTRLLGAGLFLLQRGIAAGVTIYAPAIVLSSVLGWRLDLTIILSGLIATIYTAAGGSEAVNVTQKYQMAVIMGGMVAAFVVLLTKLPESLSITDALTVAGGFHKLETVDYSINFERRYTFWSGLLGGFFLALSYFGTDQSQVQRYLTGASLRESRLGLMFNAVCKIPMQFFILLVGAMVFVFYQFALPPLFFNDAVWQAELERESGTRLLSLEKEFATIHAEKQTLIRRWLDAKHSGDASAEAEARAAAESANARSEAVRARAKKTIQETNSKTKANDTDYVFMWFVLHQLPHGLIGLLIAAIFAAALQSKAAELNALTSSTIVDFYRQFVHPKTDTHYVIASKLFTVMWGMVAVAFALFANLTENLIQAANIVASIFYPVVLALFLVAFFLRWVGGTAVFWSAVAAQVLNIVLYFILEQRISYLWYNLIGCGTCVVLSVLLEAALRLGGPREAATPS
jgi:SSS family solute:Na+ symporter